MKNFSCSLVLFFSLLLCACAGEKKFDIAGHWKVVKDVSGGQESAQAMSGITFGNDGIISYEWKNPIRFNPPLTTYRINADTLTWTSHTETVNGMLLYSGKVALEWRDEQLVVKRGKGDYSVLERASP